MLKTCSAVADRAAVDPRIITHIVHIWSDCLQLTGIYVSRHLIRMREGGCLTWRPHTGYPLYSCRHFAVQACLKKQ